MSAITLFYTELNSAAMSVCEVLVAAQTVQLASAAQAQIGIYTQANRQQLAQAAAGQIRLIEEGDFVTELADTDILLPQGLPTVFFQNALRQALARVQQQQLLNQIQQQLQQQQLQSERLMDIGIALSAEQDHPRLLELILTEARQFACCDAASIFLLDERDGKAELVFKLSQNDSIQQDFHEQRFPLNNSSVAGFVTINGEVLNIEDVYQIPATAPYQFNKAFDKAVGYRTRSMLVIPLRNNDGRILGAIQFINRKVDPNIQLTSAAVTEQNTIPFQEPLTKLLEMLASQAAVAIDNNLLVERIKLLFEGFVQASVRAIEQRDPTTSGHSFRVADLTIALARAAHHEHSHVFAEVAFNESQLRELRYAALLHDFGKVGVREHVLVKAKKLSPEAWIRFQYRVALQKEQVKNQYLNERLRLLKNHELTSERDHALMQEEQLALDKLHMAQHAVELANEPSILDNGTFEHLQALREHMIKDIDGAQKPLLDEGDFLSLAVRRGSLTEDERREIESHVTHTIRFLSTIPWTPELANIPAIAGAHHEKMDGTGYPNCLCGCDIPIGARMMAVCDIFDALTASDRPYKAALPISKAFDILNMEANNGKIDGDLVNLFVRLPLEQVLPSLRSH